MCAVDAGDECARPLKPGGTLVLSVPQRGPLARLDSLSAQKRP